MNKKNFAAFAFIVSIVALSAVGSAYAQSNAPVPFFDFTPDAMSIVFAFTCLGGTLTYILVGWYASKEPFDFVKFFDTISSKGSLTGLLISVVALSSKDTVTTIVSFAAAFTMGLGFAASLKKKDSKNPLTPEVIAQVEAAVKELQAKTK
jgi:prolipoprotein diacylglyceryltransferase